MDYWITMAVEVAVLVTLIAALSMLAWDRGRLMRENERMKKWLERAQEIRDKAVEHSDEMEKRARLERNRAEDAKKQVAEAQDRARFEMRRAMDANVEAERARKECAMHEKERRQLEEKILHLKEEYEAQAARADELMRREMENFLGYNGTEHGQKELNDDTDS